MISIIIPVYNEEAVIGKTLRYLRSVTTDDSGIEIIVCDGGSDDKSVDEAHRAGVIVIKCRRKGRAAQMNTGVRISRGAILYFLHADSLPPPSFAADIRNAVRAGNTMGCYRLRFDLNHWFLKANAWFTRFDINAFRYGDQSLFVTRECFEKAGGFSEEHAIMEDNEIVRRLKRFGRFVVLPREITTSARRYVANGVYKMQGVFYLIYFLYQIGYSQEKLLTTFRKIVRQDKL